MMILSGAALGVLFVAGVADAGYVQSWLDSKGGCQPGPLQLMEGYVRPGDRAFLGRPADAWTDEDLDEFVSVYSACVRRNAIFALGTANPTPEKIEAHISQTVSRLKRNFIEPARAQATAERAGMEAKRKLAEEQVLREQEQLAKQAERDREAAAEARRLAEDRARRERERLQEQAKRDREAAEEALRRAEVEEPKIAEVAKEAEAARQARQAAEQRLAEIRGRVDVQEKARREAIAGQRAAELSQRKELGGGAKSAKLGIVAGDFHLRFNEMAASMNFDLRATSLGCAAMVKTACRFKVNERIFVTTASENDDPLATEITVLHNPDGTVSVATVQAVTTFMIVARMLNPTGDRQKQGELVISLLNGLKDKTESEAEFDRVHFLLMKNAVGLFFIADPAVGY
ncbi:MULTISPECIES: hypothetical protein [Bradyrhizobium]|uniref:hypothetical protein n=1 Tax=Bradyrhizobium TaxID=374 RepID=UPI0013A54D98|nr:hypothetical protein [Bradyrhizobium diazoefficiens]AWO92694.2 hypothetical protein DI395_32120 [Bradyrhizobium diazoefficiens]